MISLPEYYVSHVDAQGVSVCEKFGLFDKALERFLSFVSVVKDRCYVACSLYWLIPPLGVMIKK